MIDIISTRLEPLPHSPSPPTLHMFYWMGGYLHALKRATNESGSIMTTRFKTRLDSNEWINSAPPILENRDTPPPSASFFQYIIKKSLSYDDGDHKDSAQFKWIFITSEYRRFLDRFTAPIGLRTNSS